MQAPVPPDGRHQHLVQLRFSDTDALGHVNNARFLSFVEDARIAMLRSMDVGLVETGLILARVEIDYLRQVHLDREPLRVFTEVGRVGRTSLTLVSAVEQDGGVAARAAAVCVAFDYAAQTTVPIEGLQRELLEAWAAAASAWRERTG